jgi:isoquinoline 1-oxidoreductase subunit beta
MKSTFQTSRRRFLKNSGLVIVFALPSAQRLARAATAAEFKPSAYLRIGDDDRITVVVGISEMGQGVHTAIPMLVAGSGKVLLLLIRDLHRQGELKRCTVG